MLDDVDAALNWLLRAVGEGPTGDRQADLEQGARAALRVRELNSRAGELVFSALNARGTSWEGIRTIVAPVTARKPSVRTLRRWAAPSPD